jgi:hypothetical protein
MILLNSQGFSTSSLVGTSAGPVRIKTSVWYGDGSTHSVEIYDHEAPLEVNMAQKLFLTLLRNPHWERELTDEKCKEAR